MDIDKVIDDLTSASVNRAPIGTKEQRVISVSVIGGKVLNLSAETNGAICQ